MAKVIAERVCAQIEGDFVVFLIGIRINKWWKVTTWLPAFLAMPRMLQELARLPSDQTGFLGYTTLGLGVIQQHWRSFAHLEAYANARDRAHLPAWAAFNKRAKDARGDVGIWHETYLVRAGQYETLYSGMPPMGLGKVSTLVPATGARAVARARLGQ
ncbi:MAG: DUF4188 domain-containing protein [Cypionkella sp.]